MQRRSELHAVELVFNPDERLACVTRHLTVKGHSFSQFSGCISTGCCRHFVDAKRIMTPGVRTAIPTQRSHCH